MSCPGSSLDGRAGRDGRAGLVATRAALGQLGLPGQDLTELSASARRFPDHGQWRIEIPSVEGPLAFRAGI
jgi:hypothetical protein